MGAEIEAQDQEWIEKQVAEFAKRRPDYVVLADTLQQVLDSVARRYCPLAIVQVRAKGVASFAGKALGKRGKRPDPVNQFTDLCGARLIAQTHDQVETVCDFLKEHFTIDWENSADVGERLRATEFGYRSVHYIVSFKRDAFPTRDLPVTVPTRLLTMPNPRAEVQVRTVLGHAWADMSHELLYKSGFQVPRAWDREFARLAAVLEDADATITRLCGALEAYASSYAYMTPEAMRTRVSQRRFVLTVDKSDLSVVREIGALCLLLADWDTAVETLEPYVEEGDATILRDYGLALCSKHADDRRDPEYARGREILERACSTHAADAEAWMALAGTWSADDDEIARDHYRKAFETDPANERALENYLDAEIHVERSLEIVDIVRPLIQAALERCRRRTEIGVDLVAAYLTMGKFLLLLGDSYKGLAAYAKAAQVASAPHQLEEALRSLDLLRPVADRLEGYEWVRRVLLLRIATWRKEEAPAAEATEPAAADTGALSVRRAREALSALATKPAELPMSPVVMVAGGCDPALAKQMKAYRGLVMGGFTGFCGAVVGAGTKEGVGGLVGEMAKANAANVVAVTYLPRSLPVDATVDKRYGVRRTTPGDSFSPLQPLQAWTDLVVSGVDPADVRLLGINGGPIAAIEYRLALALGASVALVEESGREAAKVASDEDWADSERLLRIPADPFMVREFVTAAPSCPGLDEERREALAREIHEGYLQTRREKPRPTDDLTLLHWSELPERYQESNRGQADSIVGKLEFIGCAVGRPAGRAVNLLRLTDDEVELLAEIEHARWVVEKLQDGWRWAPERDDKLKTSPYLVPWSELSETMRDYDREPSRKIPKLLAGVGLEVRRRPDATAPAAGAPNGPETRRVPSEER